MTAQASSVRAAAVPSRDRWQRLRWPIIGGVLFTLLVVLLLVSDRDLDDQELSIYNPGPNGARAAAEVLRQQGILVRQIDTLEAARISDPADTTLVIASGVHLQAYQLRSILQYPGPIVFLAPSEHLGDLLDLALYRTKLAEHNSQLRRITANCSFPAAAAAAQIATETVFIDPLSPTSASTWQECFAMSPDAAMLVRQASADSPATVVLLADSHLVTNSRLTEAGNAALTLWLTGAKENLVWYLGTFDTSTLTFGGVDGGKIEFKAAPGFLPPWARPVLIALLASLALVAVWRGRRFGPLVVEPLPIVVPAHEALRGRARLYRKAKAYGRAGASLRAVTALRLARKLGVPRQATESELVAAICRATGAMPATVVPLFYGPAPQSEAELADLSRRLHELSGKVKL